MWCTPAPSSSGAEDLTRRCRHAVSAVGPYVFMFGGLRGSTLLDDFLLADDSSGTELSVCDPRSPAWCARSHRCRCLPCIASGLRDFHRCEMLRNYTTFSTIPCIKQRGHYALKGVASPLLLMSHGLIQDDLHKLAIGMC